MSAQRQADFFPDRAQIRSAVSTVSALSQQYLWFYPRLIPMAGGHKGALVLSNMLHWTRLLSVKAPEREGWIWKTQAEWAQDTGLSRHELDAAIGELRKQRLLQVIKRGMPARTFYQLQIQALGDTLARELNIPPGRFEWTWANSAAMVQLLGRPTAFYTRLAEVLDSATDALHLSYLIQSQRTHMTSALTSDWITPRTAQISDRLGLSYKQQLASKKRLVAAGLIDSRMSGSMTPKPEVRIRFARIADALESKQAKIAPEQEGDGPSITLDPTGDARGVGSTNTPQQAPKMGLIDGRSITSKAQNTAAAQGGGTTTTLPTTSQTGKQGEDKPSYPQDGAVQPPVGPSNIPFFQPSEQEFTFSANRDFPFQQTGISQTGSQEFPFPADKIAEKGSLYIKKKHTELQPQETSLSGRQEENESGGGRGVLIDSIGQLQPYAALVIERLANSGLDADRQQDVADEWAARLCDKSQAALRYPLKYLDSLIVSASQGEFSIELGLAVREARAARRRREAMVSAFTKPADSSVAPNGAMPDEAVGNSEVKRQHLAKLAELTKSYRAKGVNQGGGSSTTPAQNIAAVQGDGRSITPAQNTAAVQGDGRSITPAHSTASKPNLLARLKTQ